MDPSVFEVQDETIEVTLFKFSTGEKSISNKQPLLQETLPQMDLEKSRWEDKHRDYFITGKRYIFKDVKVLNKLK